MMIVQIKRNKTTWERFTADKVGLFVFEVLGSEGFWCAKRFARLHRLTHRHYQNLGQSRAPVKNATGVAAWGAEDGLGRLGHA
jgi:hypothetical protein